MTSENHQPKEALRTQLSAPPLALLIARFARIELGTWLRRIRYALLRRRPRDLELAALVIPDSKIARQATELARDCEPTFLFHHSVRSYLFAMAVGMHLEVSPDRELLYVAAVLHDLGLVPEHDGGGSFELEGARAAHAFVRKNGMSARRAACVHEAIALHTSVGIAGGCATEIALLHFGTGVDVIGYRQEDVSTQTRLAIVDAWPREGMKAGFERLLNEQIERKPHCHFAGPHKLGFGKRITDAPFAE